MLGREDGAPPPVDLAVERRNGDFVRGLIRDGVVTAVHDLSDGGLLLAAAEMALASGVGLMVETPDAALARRRRLVRRGPGPLPRRPCPPTRRPARRGAPTAAGVPYAVIGRAGGCELALQGADGPLCAIDLDDLRTAHEGWMPAFMGEPG